MWLDEVRDETSNVLIRSFVFNRLLYLIESSDSLEGRSLLLTLAVPRNESFASLKDFGTWREIPSPDPINWLEKGGRRKKNPSLRSRTLEIRNLFDSHPRIYPRISPDYRRPPPYCLPQWYFGFKQGISIVCLIDWGGIVLLTQRSHICHPLCRS